MSKLAELEPDRDCPLCPRLVDYRENNKTAYPDYFNGAAPTFGALDSALLIVGLAPGLHGANWSGRPFTGDYAGDLLYETISKYGFSTGSYGAKPDDGLKLKNAAITNAVRCAPPQNKPTGEEIRNCRPFLKSRLSAMPNLRAILCLGRIAHNACLASFDMKQAQARFGHGATHETPRQGVRLFDSYHCSRYNTNTGRLTAAMFEDVFAAIQRYIGGAG